MNAVELERRAKKAGICDEYNCCEQLQDAIKEFLGGSFLDRDELLAQIDDLEAELLARDRADR